MKINGKALAMAFIVTIACYAIGWAITVDQIWQAVYNSANQTLRVTAVP